MRSNSTPSISWAICANVVSCPWPCEWVPTLISRSPSHRKLTWLAHIRARSAAPKQPSRRFPSRLVRRKTKARTPISRPSGSPSLLALANLWQDRSFRWQGAGIRDDRRYRSFFPTMLERSSVRDEPCCAAAPRAAPSPHPARWRPCRLRSRGRRRVARRPDREGWGICWWRPRSTGSDRREGCTAREAGLPPARLRPTRNGIGGIGAGIDDVRCSRAPAACRPAKRSR